jgi:hypothetical protein
VPSLSVQRSAAEITIKTRFMVEIPPHTPGQGGGTATRAI